jgi:hypothetical protein
MERRVRGVERVTLLGGGGHFLSEQEPDAFNRAFLKGRPPARH